MKHAAVAVVGGGIIGASVAYHLARRGVRDILVLDRGRAVGAGSTSKATGGFRAQFATAANVRLSLLARKKLRAFRDEIGIDSGYQQAGYLWIADDELTLGTLRAALAVQRSEGLGEAEEIDAATIRELNPAVAPDGILGGTWCPTDGFINPMEMLRGYMAAAERFGATLEWGVEVNAVAPGKNGNPCVLTTSGGSIEAGAVVNAAGAWAGFLDCGSDNAVPVFPSRRQVAVTEPSRALPEGMPMTIFAANGFHLRVRDGRVMLLMPDVNDRDDPLDASVNEEWLTSVHAEAAARLPSLSGLAIDRNACYTGLYEMSPDRHAILGAAPGCENLFLANGSSGHGVMHAPALGQLLSEIICDGVASSMDVSSLRPTRFAERCLNESNDLL